jgi:two-component system, OmpR family, phosphate regulon sensor histidine kinase PhoR
MSFSSPIFRKLLLSALALIAITVLPVDFYWTRFVAVQESAALQRELAAEAGVMRDELERFPPGDLGLWARQEEARIKARVTVIDPSGKVLADSQGNPETMENHSQRPEVARARSGQTGVAVRLSATLGRDMFYVAVPLTYGSQPGHALRVAAPVRDLQGAISSVRRRVVPISLGAALIALAMAYVFSRRFTNRLMRVQRFSEELATGDFQAELPRDTGDELGSLAMSLNKTGAQLKDFINRLENESARSQGILASMVEGVVAVDRERKVLFYNPAFARAVHAPEAVAERSRIVEYIRDPEFLDLIAECIRDGRSARRRIRLAEAGGHSYEVHAAPLQGTRPAAIAVLHDITELERLERVRRDFVANVSHELRTPLAAIAGYSETLLDGALEDTENNRKFVEIIRSHSIRLNNIASDLLALSELESGGPEAAPEPVSIKAALEAAARVVESEANVREVALEWGTVEPVFAMGNRLRLEQAFVNLMDNAVKFNRPKGRVGIEAVRDAGMIRISISDTGIGIPSIDQPRIFERFYRVDKARSRQVGGTGLGLSIVKHVAERMNGTISVESQLGKGSVFIISVPEAPIQE